MPRNLPAGRGNFLPVDELQTRDTRLETAVDKPVAPRPLRSDIGGYQILEELGRGGAGVVYKAFDAELKRYVAIKVLNAGSNASVDMLVRFRGEAEVVAKLQHPHIVQIYDSGEFEGQPFLVLELVDGGSLDKQLAGQPQNAREAATIVETLARAVHVAHQEGIVHRDLKPANVLRSRAGTLKITDFGLAKQIDQSLGFSRTGDLRGTPQYMAPEQASGEHGTLSPATDVHALGAMLYEMLTGRPPFVANNLLDILDQIIKAEPASPSQLVPRLPRDLCTICLKCLEKDRERRYQSAEALADDLHRWLDGLPIHARPQSRTEKFFRNVRRHPLVAGLIVSFGVIAVVSTLYIVAARERAQQRQFAAELETQYESSLGALDSILKTLIADPQLRQHKVLRQTLLEHYRELLEKPPDEQHLKPLRITIAYGHLAKLLDTIGDKHGACAAYRHVLPILDKLEKDGEHRPELPKMHLEIGELLTELAEFTEAEAEIRLAVDMLRQRYGDDPSPVIARQDLAEAWHSLGLLLDRTGRKREGLKNLVKGRTLRAMLYQENPENPQMARDLARSHGYIGDVELDLGQSSDAEISYSASHAVRERVAQQNDKNLEAKFQFARSFRNFGNMHLLARDYAKALQAYDDARQLQEDLVKRDSATADYQADLANSYWRMAELKLMVGAVNEARPYATKAVEIARPLYAADPAGDYRRLLADSLLQVALAGIDEVPDAAWPVLDEIITLVGNQPSDVRALFTLACARSLRSERPGANPQEATQAIATLGDALGKNYRPFHHDDLQRARAFRSVVKDDSFVQLLCNYAAGPTPN